MQQSPRSSSNTPDPERRIWRPDPADTGIAARPPRLLPPAPVEPAPMDPIALFYKAGASLEALEMERDEIERKMVAQKTILESLNGVIVGQVQQAHGKLTSPLFAFDSSPYTVRKVPHVN